MQMNLLRLKKLIAFSRSSLRYWEVEPDLIEERMAQLPW
jgi:hypothetical protein